jgi:hypothetical protein
MGEMRNAYKILVRKLEGKRQFARSTHKWKNNIRMDLMEVGWEIADWIHVTQDRGLLV